MHALTTMKVTLGVVCLLLGAALGQPPTNFNAQYLGYVANGQNLVGLRFLPNGQTLFIDRSGFVAIGDVYNNAVGINTNTYIDLSSVTFCNQYG